MMIIVSEHLRRCHHSVSLDMCVQCGCVAGLKRRHLIAVTQKLMLWKYHTMDFVSLIYLHKCGCLNCCDFRHL